MGQQVLTLDPSCDEGFVPLDSELFISQTKAIELYEPFEDGRRNSNPSTIIFVIINITNNTGCCDKTQSILNRHIYFYYIFP